MKTTFLTLILLVFGFSSFAFMPNFPAESSSEKNIAVTSEKPKSESETKTEAKAETKTITAKELTQKVEANYEANKKNMNFKERIAHKILIKKLKKDEKKQLKSTNSIEAAKDADLGTIFRIIGVVFIVVGLIGLLLNNYALSYTLTLILIGVLFLILPSLL